MKIRTLLKISALLLAVALLLTGCTSALEDLVDGMFNFGGEAFNEEDRFANSMDIVVQDPNGEYIYDEDDGVVAVKPPKTEEKPTTDKPTAAQNGTATADELTMFRNMKPAQLERDYITPAIGLYGIFDGLGSLDCDWDITIEKNGIPYQKVKASQPDLNPNVDFTKYENFRNHMYTVFSKKLTDRLLSENGNMYITHNGSFYICAAGRGGDIAYQGYTCAVTNVTNTAVTCTVYAKYVKEQYLDQMWEDNNFTLTNDMIETDTINFKLVKQNGNWVFDNFYLWY